MSLEAALRDEHHDIVRSQNKDRDQKHTARDQLPPHSTAKPLADDCFEMDASDPNVERGVVRSLIGGGLDEDFRNVKLKVTCGYFAHSRRVVCQGSFQCRNLTDILFGSKVECGVAEVIMQRYSRL